MFLFATEYSAKAQPPQHTTTWGRAEGEGRHTRGVRPGFAPSPPARTLVVVRGALADYSMANKK